MIACPRQLLGRGLLGALAALASTGCQPAAPPRPPAAPAMSWPVYGGDPGGSRYSAASQIRRANVQQLRIAWTFNTGPNSPEATDNPKEGKPPNFEATPIVVDGRMYVSTPLGRVFALDPATGKVQWQYDAHVDVSGNWGDNATRGVATWLDSAAAPVARCRRRVFLATIDARLIALDAETGAECTDFGAHGRVNLLQGLRNPPEYVGEYEETSPPTVVNGVVVVGSAIADNNRVEAPSGIVRGYDARTGALRWGWEPVPQDSTDPGWATWRGRNAHRTGAANAWSVMAADPVNDLVFVPTGSASPDYYGGARPGANLYANSVVALRASTGARVWHFQLVHHDLWDFDVAAPPLLATIPRGGHDLPVVIQTGKTAQLFVLDRMTGAPVLPVTEEPVPQTDVPGEQTSLTQPFSTALPLMLPPGPDVRAGFGLVQADREACHARLSGLRYQGPFTPPSLQGSLAVPSNIGGAQWGGVAYDSVRHIVVVPLNHLATAVQLIPRAVFDRMPMHMEPGWEYTAMTGAPYGMRRQVVVSPSGIPCTPPPFSTLLAVSLVTGQKVWEVPLGDARRALMLAGHPAADSAAPAMGTSALGGPIVTAGGLVFMAGTADNYLRAFDIETGTVLWHGELPGRARATPMTYVLARNGRQYVVVGAGADKMLGRGATVVAFTLP